MIRQLALTDAENLLAYFQELVKADHERVERPADADKLTIKDERSWIEKCLGAEEKNEMYVRCSEVDGKIVTVGEIERKPRWIERHVGEIRFGVLPGYEAKAYQLVQKLEAEAKKNGIKVLLYFHLATQKAGLAIMKKTKFSEVGKVKDYYKRGNQYIDRIYLQKRLK